MNKRKNHKNHQRPLSKLRPEKRYPSIRCQQDWDKHS